MSHGLNFTPLSAQELVDLHAMLHRGTGRALAALCRDCRASDGLNLAAELRGLAEETNRELLARMGGQL